MTMGHVELELVFERVTGSSVHSILVSSVHSILGSFVHSLFFGLTGMIMDSMCGHMCRDKCACFLERVLCRRLARGPPNVQMSF